MSSHISSHPLPFQDNRGGHPFSTPLPLPSIISLFFPSPECTSITRLLHLINLESFLHSPDRPESRWPPPPWLAAPLGLNRLIAWHNYEMQLIIRFQLDSFPLPRPWGCLFYPPFRGGAARIANWPHNFHLSCPFSGCPLAPPSPKKVIQLNCPAA